MSEMNETAARMLLRNRRMLLDFIYGLVHRINDAEDLFQEVGLVIMKSVTAPEDNTEFGKWSRQIAKNVVRHYWRSSSRHACVVLNDRMVDAIEKSYDENAEVAEFSHAHRRALNVCLDELQPAQRDVLHKRYYEGLTSKEIGEKLQKNETSIRMLVMRIRNRLYSCMQRRLAMEAPHEQNAF